MQAGGLKDRGKRPWLTRLGEEEEQGWHSDDEELCEGLGRLLRAGALSPGVRLHSSSNAVAESTLKPFLT